MPTKNPRLSVVLSPSMAATLAALSEATGDSASSLVRGLLEQTEPALQRMVQLVNAAKQAKGSIGSGVGQSLDRVVSDLEDALVLAEHRAGRVVRDLVDSAETVKGRRRGTTGAAGSAPAAAAVPSTPVLVTRGSGRAKASPSVPAKGGRNGKV